MGPGPFHLYYITLLAPGAVPLLSGAVQPLFYSTAFLPSYNGPQGRSLLYYTLYYITMLGPVALPTLLYYFIGPRGPSTS